MKHTIETKIDDIQQRQSIIELDLENDSFDFDTEELNFKPLTSGLGINQEREKRVFKKTISAPVNNTQISSYLDVFENKRIQKNKETQTKEVEKEVELQLASRGMQLSAWLIDVLIILTLMSITLLFSSLTPGMRMNDFLGLISFKDMVIFSIIMFSGYYLIYFTIMDFFVTPGKYLFNMKLLKTSEMPITIKDTFIRAVVSLVSFSALGLPLYIDFHGKISDTKVIVKNFF